MASEPYRILLVDDDGDTRVALRRSIQTPEYVIHECRDAREAIEFARENEVDAVLADFDMPGINGLDLLTQIRLSRPDVVRMLVTARADISLAIRAINEGAVHRYVLKPWDNVNLRGMLDMTLHGMRARRAPR